MANEPQSARKPRTSRKKAVSVRLDPGLHGSVTAVAQRHKCGFSEAVTGLLETALAPHPDRIDDSDWILLSITLWAILEAVDDRTPGGKQRLRENVDRLIELSDRIFLRNWVDP